MISIRKTMRAGKKEERLGRPYSACNLEGLSSLLSAYGLKVIEKRRVAVKYRQRVIDLLDRVMSKSPSFASGLVVLATKNESYGFNNSKLGSP